jgi:hypothetical protein
LLAGCASTKSVERGSSEEASAKAKGDEAEDRIAVGKKIRPIVLDRLDAPGQLRVPSAKLTLVDFGATWCTISQKWIPRLEETYRRHHPRGLEIVFVSQDDEDGNQRILPFVRENGGTFPVAWDSGHRLADRWRPPAWQSFVLVDDKGIVRWIYRGMRTESPELLEAEITKVLGAL